MTLGDMLTLQRGFDITKKEQRAGGVPVVSSSGVSSTHDTAKVDGPGVVVGRKGSLGTTYYLKEPFWPHDTTLWVKDFKDNDPYYCYLLLKTLNLADLDAGSSNPTLNRNHAHLLSVRCPRRATQSRIGSVIAAFDELIEINERRIEVLEDLARSLYREWFVLFRFPGHENVDLVDSDLGPIPKGWEVQPCGEALDFIGGGTPSKRNPTFWDDGSIHWFTPSDLTKSRRRFIDQSALQITDAGLAKSSARLFPAGSVLMTSRATLGVLAVASQPATCNQGFIVFPPSERFPSAFIYEWLDSRRAELEAISTGATFKEITKGALKRFPILLPTADLAEGFGRTIEPVERLIESLEQRNRVLADARDLLLPRLVTGQLDISDIDLGVLTPPEAA